MGDAWDVAYAFILPDESKYVTGLELVVDGGISLKTQLRDSDRPIVAWDQND
jgi:hypothetical protein